MGAVPDMSRIEVIKIDIVTLCTLHTNQIVLCIMIMAYHLAFQS